MKTGQHLILLGLVCLQALMPSPVVGFAVFRDRASVLQSFGMKDSGEERLYLEYCKQSSSTGNCMLAIDDDVLHEWTQCASTEAEQTAWWQAQLETPSYITRVIIHTVEMPDVEMQSALSDFAILASSVECFRFISSEKFETKSFPCDALGDKITIQSYKYSGVLSLCEIEVFGKALVFRGMESGEMELDFHGCDQSTTLEENECSAALDRVFLQYPGNDNKVCAQTEVEETAPWWVVYFMEPALVRHVKIFNRVDCCTEELSNFVVKVNEDECAKHEDLRPFIAKVLICERFGSYVKVESRREKSKITLCQVQVFGHVAKSKPMISIEYLGCYKDNPEDQDFEMQVSFTWMSPMKCHKICKRNNKVYFGLQNGRVCMCGNKYGRHGRTYDSECELPCQGDQRAMCGGVGRNRVYEITL